MTLTLKKTILTLKMGGSVHLPQRGHVLLRLCYQGQGHLIQGHIGNYPLNLKFDLAKNSNRIQTKYLYIYLKRALLALNSRYDLKLSYTSARFRFKTSKIKICLVCLMLKKIIVYVQKMYFKNPKTFLRIFGPDPLKRAKACDNMESYLLNSLLTFLPR